MEKIILFLFSVLLFSIVGVIFINPQGVEKVRGAQAPIFEFRDYTFYNIDENGVDEFLISAEGYHYARREVLKDITYYKKNDTSVDILESDRATIYKNHSDFNGSVVYNHNGEYKLISKDVRYNKRHNTVAGKRPFVINSENGEVNGTAFVVDLKKRVLKADNIRSHYEYETVGDSD